MLGHGIGRIGRDVDDMDLAECMPDVYVVVTRRAKRDQPDAKIVQLVNDTGIDRVVDKNANDRTSFGQFGRIRVQFRLNEFEIDVFLLSDRLERWQIIGLGIKKSDLHKNSPFTT